MFQRRLSKRETACTCLDTVLVSKDYTRRVQPQGPKTASFTLRLKNVLHDGFVAILRDSLEHIFRWPFCVGAPFGQVFGDSSAASWTLPIRKLPVLWIENVDIPFVLHEIIYMEDEVPVAGHRLRIPGAVTRSSSTLPSSSDV